MQPTFTHAALHVQDVEASAAFYRDVCGMRVSHARESETSEGGRTRRILWLTEPGREREFVFVLIPGGKARAAIAGDFGHLGFALESREALDEIARRVRARGALPWEPRQEPYPVGYYFGVSDPDGNMVEFSYGQPLSRGSDATIDGTSE